MIDFEGDEVRRGDARHEAQFHPATEHLVDDRDFLRQAQRMVERHDIAHRTYAQALGTRPRADAEQRRRTHQAFVGTDVMFHAEGVVKARVVANLQLAPQLLVALMRSHVGLGPDVGEMREFHRLSFCVAFRIPVNDVTPVRHRYICNQSSLVPVTFTT